VADEASAELLEEVDQARPLQHLRKVRGQLGRWRAVDPTTQRLHRQQVLEVVPAAADQHDGGAKIPPSPQDGKASVDEGVTFDTCVVDSHPVASAAQDLFEHGGVCLLRGHPRAERYGVSHREDAAGARIVARGWARSHAKAVGIRCGDLSQRGSFLLDLHVSERAVTVVAGRLVGEDLHLLRAARVLLSCALHDLQGLLDREEHDDRRGDPRCNGGDEPGPTPRITTLTRNHVLPHDLHGAGESGARVAAELDELYTELTSS
jgi:hypothetical protein